MESLTPRILSLKNLDRQVIGKIYTLVTPKSIKPQKNIFLTGAVHGDEPAGAIALLTFLEKDAPAYYDHFRFYIIPVVNPIGFEKDQANNASNENINRSFTKIIHVQEAKVIAEQLKKWNQKFAFTIDMHEIPPDWEGEGFTKKDNPHDCYLYETQRDKKKRFGRQMIDTLPKDITVSNWPQIYGDIAVMGLVSYPEDNFNPVYAEGTTLDAYLFQKYSTHTFTSETPTGWPMEKRVRAHLSWLRTALRMTR